MSKIEKFVEDFVTALPVVLFSLGAAWIVVLIWAVVKIVTWLTG